MSEEADKKIDETAKKNVETGKHEAAHEKSERRKDLIETLDRLVAPLDQILLLMRDHQRAQRRLLLVTFAVAAMVVVAAVYQVRLVLKMRALEDQLSAMNRTGEETKNKVAEAEKKIDEDKLRALLQPEIRVKSSPGGATSAVLVVKSAPSSSSASARPSPREVAFEIGQVTSSPP